MDTITLISTREAAQNLQVHARTVRKWIDTFEEYVCPEINEKGHYVMDDEGIEKLKDIKQRLQESNKSMKQVKDDLVYEGKISLDPPPMIENKVLPNEEILGMVDTVNGISDVMEEMFERMERIEDHMFSLFEYIEDMEHKLVAANKSSVSSNDVHQMFDDIRKRQDQLRIEMRNVSFSQRLTSATSDGPLPRRQKKTRFLGIF